MKKIVTFPLILLTFFLTSCTFSVPIAENQNLPLDPSILGVWNFKDKETITKLTISVYSKTEYSFILTDNKGGEIFCRGYPVIIDGIKYIQLIETNNNFTNAAIDKPYEIISYKFSNGKLAINQLTKLEDNQTTTAQLRKDFLSHQDKNELFSLIGSFTKLSSDQIPSETDSRNAARKKDDVKVESQTAREYSSKSDLEKAKILNDLIQGFHRDLEAKEVNGQKKLPDVLIRQRRVSNLLYVLFNPNTSKYTETSESLGTSYMNRLLALAADKDPDKDISNYLIQYTVHEYDEYYTNSKALWKKTFDTKTDVQQQAQFETEIGTRYKNLKSESALYIAARDGKTDEVKALLIQGVNLNKQFEFAHNMTALMVAVFENHLEVVRILLSKGADVNLKTDNGLTVWEIAKNKDQEIIAALKAKGAGINEDFLYAAARGDLATVRNLLIKKADINTTDASGVTPLMKASANGYLEVVNLLTANGADLNLQNNNGLTALMVAATPAIATLLLNKGADINIKDNSGQNALTIAVIQEKPLVVKLLLTKNINVNYTDGDKNALQYAVVTGNLEIIRTLIAAGADPNMKTKTCDCSAYDLAMHSKNSDVYSFFLTLNKTQP